jgi:hypothetical protein
MDEGVTFGEFELMCVVSGRKVLVGISVLGNAAEFSGAVPIFLLHLNVI